MIDFEYYADTNGSLQVVVSGPVAGVWKATSPERVRVFVADFDEVHKWYPGLTPVEREAISQYSAIAARLEVAYESIENELVDDTDQGDGEPGRY